MRYGKAAQKTDGASIVFAVLLTLILLLLAIFDYARMLKKTGLTVGALALLALLSLLSIRLMVRRRRAGQTGAAAVTMPAPSARTGAILLSALTLLAALLRLYQLGAESFWYDETWTATWAAQALRDVVQIVNPFAYLVAHLTMSLSRSEFALRLGPALAGIALIPAVYLLGRQLYGRGEGLIAAGLLSVSAFAIYHGQDLRFYAWQMLLSTLAFYFLIRGLEGGGWLDWGAFALTTTLNLYVHPYALFALASQGLYVLAILISDLLPLRYLAGSRRRESLRAWWRRLIRPAAAALLALAAFGPGWSLLSSSLTSRWVIETGEIGVAPTAPHDNPWFASPFAVWIYGLPRELLNAESPLLLLVILALFVLGLVASTRRRVGLVLLWVLAPLPILALMRVVIYFRYFSYFLPLLTIVVAHGIQHLAGTIAWRPVRQAIAAGLLTALVAAPSLAALPGYYLEPQKQQWREVIAQVEEHWQPGDLILVHSLHRPAMLPFDWYSTVPEEDLPRQAFLEGLAVTDRSEIGGLEAATEGHRRVWFVFCRTPEEGWQAIIEAMHGPFRTVNNWAFEGIDLVLFESHHA